jgi:hypothetical protein
MDWKKTKPAQKKATKKANRQPALKRSNSAPFHWLSVIICEVHDPTKIMRQTFFAVDEPRPCDKLSLCYNAKNR